MLGLAVRRTVKWAGALKRQEMIPTRGIGALSRRRSLTGRAGAHPFSTPYSVEQADEVALQYTPRSAPAGAAAYREACFADETPYAGDWASRQDPRIATARARRCIVARYRTPPAWH